MKGSRNVCDAYSLPTILLLVFAGTPELEEFCRLCFKSDPACNECLDERPFYAFARRQIHAVRGTRWVESKKKKVYYVHNIQST